ncbi:hypothetical protein [Aeromonas caviae]|nr:hypothetical protein [Aeromonas caviae]NAZ62337.1 hypothetical protein [Aeromonas caviae]
MNRSGYPDAPLSAAPDAPAGRPARPPPARQVAAWLAFLQARLGLR